MASVGFRSVGLITASEHIGENYRIGTARCATFAE